MNDITKKIRGYSRRQPVTEKKFIDLYTSKYGELSATDCAIKVGYERESAHTRASELLDWRNNPEAVREIDARQLGNKEVWLLDKVKHLANLTRIQQEARAKGQYGVAIKAEELKDKVQGFYVDRNLTLTKELSEEDITKQMRSMFNSREEYEAAHKGLAEELFLSKKVKDEDKT